MSFIFKRISRCISKRRAGVALLIGVAVFGIALAGEASAAPKAGKDRGKSAIAHAKNAERKGKVVYAPASPTTVVVPARSIEAASVPAPNGNGNGKATGKPCAGCVGNANSKTPPGQKADGSDKNKGHRCDANNGIGKGTPAHKGCAVATVAKPTAAVKVTEVAAAPAPAAPVADAAPAQVSDAQAQQPAMVEVKDAQLAKTGKEITLPLIAGILLTLVGLGAVVALHNTRINWLHRRMKGAHLATYGPPAPVVTKPDSETVVTD